MLKEQLQKIQEFPNTFDQTYEADLFFAKLPNNDFCIIVDIKGQFDQTRGSFITVLRGGLPVVIVFKNEKDLHKLTKINSTIDTEAFFGVKAQKLIKTAKILRKGKAKLVSRLDTLILSDVKLEPFKKDSVIVVRVDSYSPSKISKTTNEVPATTYFRMKASKNDMKNLKEFIDPISMSTIAIIGFIMSLAMMFIMLGIYISGSKRNKKLEKKLKNVLKDGKDWKVYIIKEDAPNAFCIATPRMFLFSGVFKIMNEDEIMAIMIHEAGHIKNKDVWKHLAITQTFIAMLVGLSFIAATPPFQIALLIVLIINATSLREVIIARTIGRGAEKNADSLAVKYGYGDALISALKKMENWVNSQQAKRPCGKMCQFYTKVSETLDEHPPLKKRVENILKSKETWEEKNMKNLITAKKYFAKQLNIDLEKEKNG